MNCHEVLSILISNDDDNTENFNDKLERILQKTIPLLPEDIRQHVREDLSIRSRYLHLIMLVLRTIKECSVNTDTFFSVNQYRSVKIAIELIVSMGIIPCLLPGVGIDMAKLCPRAKELPQEELTDMQKYERLSFSTNILLDLFEDHSLRPAVLSQFSSLMASLLQLSHAPLAKPLTKTQQQSTTKLQFLMTVEIYEKLQNDQKEFNNKFISLLDNCPQYICIKELMVIFGIKNTPNWLRRETRKYLINRIMQPNGIVSLIAAVCDDDFDLGADWDKLETISRLIAVSHGKSINEYYEAVCPQFLDLLSSDRIKHVSTMANCCIIALYDYNPDVCRKYILNIICAPLIVKESDCTTKIVRTEKEIERCIENLAKCFLREDAKFKQLPCKIISEIATPLFCLYHKIYQSACILKSKIQRLLLKFLEEETIQEQLYAIFLGHSASTDFGNFVTTQFGPSGGLEIISLNKNINYEELADTMFNLVSTTKHLFSSLFRYMLKFLSNINKLSNEVKQQKLLETENDKIERIEKQLAAFKLLSQLASTSTVQDAQVKNPKPLLNFIKSLFDEYKMNIKIYQTKSEECECEILYISLMLIKIILTESKAVIEIELFKNFCIFLKDLSKNSDIPTQLKTLINEVVVCIETHSRFEGRCYQDLSKHSIASNKFDEAIKDLADPLLPVRAHGLITLTKLIETQDPGTIARKAIILRLFEENLKHEDSFIYLASINGLCALATAFPQVVIETLVQEYIDMPQRVAGTEISVETRIKLGEILVKTTRALGEMSVIHKNTLVNGFLCATRDPDPLVRASSLSCLGELCKVLGFRLGNILIEVVYCIACIVKSDKAPECRRAAVMVTTLLFRGLGKDVLTSLGRDLVDLYRGLKHLRDNDDDPVLRLHVQLALEEIDYIMQDLLFAPPKLEKINVKFINIA